MRTTLKTINLLLLFLISSSSLLYAFANDGDETERYREFLTFNASNGLADNSSQVIKCTRTGRMIISTIGNLNFYDGGSFSHIDTHRSFQLPLANYTGSYSINFDHYHHIWLKNNHSVTCVDLYMEQFIPDPLRVVRELGCNDSVLDVYTDSLGDVWFETPHGLYDVQSKLTFAIDADGDLQNLETVDGQLYTFYGNGEVVAADRPTGAPLRRSRWKGDRQLLNSRQIVLLHADSLFYVIRQADDCSQLLKLNQETMEWTKLMEVPYQLNNMAMNNGHLYIACDYGYWIRTPQGELIHRAQLMLVGGRVLTPKCNDICFDRQNGMWIVTESRGVLFARTKMSPIKSLSLNDPQARHYMALMNEIQRDTTEYQGRQTHFRFVDSRNWTWHGTNTGLYAYSNDGKGDSLHFSKTNGLLNNVIHSIVEDKDHNLWVGTSYGISCILFKDRKPVFVNSFNHNDKVPDEAFLNNKAMCLEDGTIVMQTVDHVVCFHPAEFTTTLRHGRSELNPKLIKLLVNGNFVEAGQMLDGNVVIDRAITRAKDIWLKADQNSISMTFSGLNYFRPLQTCYRAKVTGKGINNDWKVYTYFNGSGLVDSRGLLHLPLVGLKPGVYEVEVQASMFPDLWENQTTRYIWRIHVEQPWWQARGVYALMGGLLLILLGYNIVVYSRNTRMRANINAEEGAMVRRIESFVERCESFDKTLLSPVEDELLYGKYAPQTSHDFTVLMARLMPSLRSKKRRTLSMRRLSEESGMDIHQFYQLLSGNLYKNPRPVIMLIRLEKAARLLATTQKSLEEISSECLFYTPNYLIGNFYHRYKVTPQQFRQLTPEERNAKISS